MLGRQGKNEDREEEGRWGRRGRVENKGNDGRLTGSRLCSWWKKGENEEGEKIGRRNLDLVANTFQGRFCLKTSENGNWLG